jgi:hypothetical protein
VAVVQYTFTHKTIHRTTQKFLEECGPCPIFARYTLAFALQLRKKAWKNIFENELFPTVMVQQRQQGNALWCCMFLNGLISMFVFDILQIPGGCS